MATFATRWPIALPIAVVRRQACKRLVVKKFGDCPVPAAVRSKPGEQNQRNGTRTTCSARRRVTKRSTAVEASYARIKLSSLPRLSFLVSRFDAPATGLRKAVPIPASIRPTSASRDFRRLLCDREPIRGPYLVSRRVVQASAVVGAPLEYERQVGAAIPGPLSGVVSNAIAPDQTGRAPGVLGGVRRRIAQDRQQRCRSLTMISSRGTSLRRRSGGASPSCARLLHASATSSCRSMRSNLPG